MLPGAHTTAACSCAADAGYRRLDCNLLLHLPQMASLQYSSSAVFYYAVERAFNMASSSLPSLNSGIEASPNITEQAPGLTFTESSVSESLRLFFRHNFSPSSHMGVCLY